MVTSVKKLRAKALFGISSVVVAVFLACVYVYTWCSPLVVFSRRISEADRAVARLWTNQEVSITLTGNDLRMVVEAVSGSDRDLTEYACEALSEVEFYNKSDRLGRMVVCLELIWIDGKQYRDHTGALPELIDKPLLKLRHGSKETSAGDR